MTRLARLLATCCMLLATTFLQANEDLQEWVLPLDSGMLSPGTTVKLKALALKHRPDADIDHVRLLAVQAVAASQQGKGRIRLKVGNAYSPWQRVPKALADPTDPEAAAFDMIRMKSPGPGAGQVWQLQVNGNIRIREIRLYVLPAAAPPSI